MSRAAPESLAAAVRSVAPHLDPALVSRRTARRLVALAHTLPPLHHAGFECRLSGADRRVDLQQCVAGSRPELILLREHALSRGARGNWARVVDLCATWLAGAGPLATHGHSVWMGFDLDGQAGTQDAPSALLVGLRPEYRDIRTQVRCAEAIAAAILPAPLPHRSVQRLAEWIAACPAGAALAGAGVRWSGGVPRMRLALGSMTTFQAPGFLARVAAPAGPALLDALADVAPAVDHVTVLADIQAVAPISPEEISPEEISPEEISPEEISPEEISPEEISVECFPADRALDEAHPLTRVRWAGLIERLASAGLCSVRKRRALPRWAGHSTPVQAAADWPEALILESLRRPADRLSALGRRLTHVKLSGAEGTPVRAKAYFGFLPLWLAASPPGPARRPPRPRRGRRDPLRAAVDALLALRGTDGWWRDYPALERGSDEWVTATAGYVLARSGGRLALSVARETWATLCRENVRDGWGHRRGAPGDAESTAWALRLAGAIGEWDSARAQAARRFVALHRRAGGGIASYDVDHFREHAAKTDSPLLGWSAPHVEVTAVACVDPDLRDAACDWLAGRQRADGEWVAYWYADGALVTALSIEALTLRGAPGDRERVARAARWCAARADADGVVFSRAYGGPCPHAAACCLLGVLQARHPPSFPAALRMARWLAAVQRVDGTFTPSTVLREPPPDAPVTERVPGQVALDDAAVFTTATAVLALCALRDQTTMGAVRDASPVAGTL